VNNANSLIKLTAQNELELVLHNLWNQPSS